MTLDSLKASIRPLVSGIAGFATAIALFVPSVPSEKMVVTATLAGAYHYFRSKEKCQHVQGGS